MRPAPLSPTDAMRARDGEAPRKLIHVALSIVAAAVAAFLPHVAAATVLASATFIALSIEAARRWSGSFGARFTDLVGPMLRPREQHRLTGATTLAIGYTLAVLVLPGWPAVGGILVAGVADPAAALVGRRFGRHRYRGGKSVEGSAAFLATAFATILALPGIGVVDAALVAMALTVLEAPTLPVDDNLYLPGLGAAAVALVLGAGVGGFS
jgi:dolichol kinase